MRVMSLTSATRLCWSVPSGPCGWCWTASIRCGCPCIAPGVWTSATTAAWRASTRPRRRPNTARPRWRSGDAPTTSHHHPWTPSTTSTPPSARWAGHWQPPEMCQISMLDWFLKGHVTLNVMSLQDRRYGDLTEDQLPSCESLKDTIARALPFWNEEIVPQIKEGKRVLIAAHGNSLRGIVKHLEGEKPSQTP